MYTSSDVVPAIPTAWTPHVVLSHSNVLKCKKCCAILSEPTNSNLQRNEYTEVNKNEPKHSITKQKRRYSLQTNKENIFDSRDYIQSFPLMPRVVARSHNSRFKSRSNSPQRNQTGGHQQTLRGLSIYYIVGLRLATPKRLTKRHNLVLRLAGK
jgi:hypothetical protein